MTMKPSMRRRFTTSKPGMPRGDCMLAVSYCETAPQHTTRPFWFIWNSAASSTGPPTLSKNTSMPLGAAAARSLRKDLAL